MRACLYKGIGRLILILAFILILAGCSFASGSHGVMSGKTSNAKTDTIKKEYSLKEGDIVNFKYESTVKEGSLSMKLVDSAGKTLDAFDTDKSEDRDVRITKSDNYTLIVELEDFKGSYRIEVKVKG